MHFLFAFMICFGQHANADLIFGTKMLPGPVNSIFKGYQRVISLDYKLKNLAQDCRDLGSRFCAWEQLIESAQGKKKSFQLRMVHVALKTEIKYLSDQEVHHQEEYFQSARETMDLRSGDCEDYSILGMWILEQLGFASEDLYIVLAGDRPEKIDHAVLAVKLESKFQIIDNRAREIYSGDRDLGIKPGISFNKNGVWLHARLPVN